MKILDKNQVTLGGFAGLKEHRLVTDPRVWGPYAAHDAWAGLGNFVYLADATFMPHGETGMHPHRNIDIVSIMLKGQLAHQGSLEHGELLKDFDVQVQRSGQQGFQHNEINPDPKWNRMLQLWLLPKTVQQAGSYEKIAPKQGDVTLVYGDTESTKVSVALLNPNQEILLSGESMVYLSKGSGHSDNRTLNEGYLIHANDFEFTANEPSHLVLIEANSSKH